MTINSKEFKKTVEEILALIQKEKDSLVVVEGKKDKKALNELGFRRVFVLGKPLYKVVEAVEATNDKRIILLTDLDKEGKRLYSVLKKELDKRGVFVDNKLRHLLFKTDLRQIEGMSHYLKKTGLQSESL